MKLKTIRLQNKEYAQVPERVKYFNSHNLNGSIDTEPKIQGEGLIVKASIYPDVKNMDRKFTGHSFGKMIGEKALEKLETVAVGRALAFMGIMADGGIASAEEMEKFQDAEPFKGDEFKKTAERIKIPDNYAPPLKEREDNTATIMSSTVLSDMEKLKHILNGMGGNTESSALLLLKDKTGLSFKKFKDIPKTKIATALNKLTKI